MRAAPAPDPAALASFPDGARVLVQGASRGIGLEFVRRLLACANVARVSATCRAPGDARELQELAARDPRLRLLALDVTDEATIAAAADAVRADGARLHLLLNCAGLLHDGAGVRPEKRLADVSLDALQRSFAVNAFGPLLVAKHFVPLFRHPERAVLATLSARVGSIADNRLGGWYAYRGAKAAQNMFTRTLAIELARSAPGTLVVALHPGTTDTGLSRPFQRNVDPDWLFAPGYTAHALLRVIDGLGPDDHGSFLAFDGEWLPW